MSIKVPQSTYSQPNNSDKFGNLWATKNVNLDSEGYIKLSPRTVNMFDDSGNVANSSDDDFDISVAFGRFSNGRFYLATTDEPFDITISNTGKTIVEDTGSNNPSLDVKSHGCWWQNKFHVSTTTTVTYKDPSSGNWTANAITGLSSSYRHWLTVFKNRNQLCVSNGNVVKQYDTSYSNTTDLTIPSDFEVIGMAYNNNKLGIITRLGSDSSGQNGEAFFFWWDGATTQANFGTSVGAYSCIGIVPYKSSFVIITYAGELLYFNGGGFDKLAEFPFYFEENRIGDLLNFQSYGDIMQVDGDVIYINIVWDLSRVGKKQQSYLVNNPSGVWCYDPKVGLYHRYSPSISKAYLHSIASANVNTSTDLFTTSVTIPETGNPVLLTSGTVGGIKQNTVYYVIRVSSTTFRLSETREEAIAGAYIDITSADTDQYFWMFDIVDYGATSGVITGAVTLYGSSSRIYRDVVFGGRYNNTSLNNLIVLCSATPFLEARGHFILPKVFSQSVEDQAKKVFVKFKPLDTNDKILVKVKTRFPFNLQAASEDDSQSFIWTGKNGGYTTVDLADAKTYFDTYGNASLELELISGAGAGQAVQVTDINYDSTSGRYSLELAEDVVGASAGLESLFSLDNWEVLSTITNAKNDDGYAEVLIGKSSKVFQIKVELRGYETTIEELHIVSDAYKFAQ